MQTQFQQWKTDPAKWLEAQPELIDCRRNIKMLPSSCRSYLRKFYGLVQTLGCMGSRCPHYQPPAVLPKMDIQPMVSAGPGRWDEQTDMRAFLTQSGNFRAAMEAREEKAQPKSKLQSDYEAKRAAGKAKRQQQDKERAGKMAQAEVLLGQGLLMREIGDILGVHENTIRRWSNEGPGRAGKGKADV